MKKKEKKMLLTIIVIGVIIIGGLLLIRNAGDKKNKGNEPAKNDAQQVEEKYVDVLEDGTKLNKSNKLQETKKVDGLEISGMQLTNKNGVTVLLATVTNKSGRSVPATEIVITMYDDKGKVIDTLNGVISPMEEGGTSQLNMGVSSDYANAYDFKVEKK